MLAARSTDALQRIVTEVRAGGGLADAVTVDLADRASIRAAVHRVEELHGRLDGAFNNGAVVQQPGPLDTTSDEDIDDQFAVNFRAHWTAMNAEVALMRRDGGGAIVNTSSIGSRRANSFLPAYGAMKRALNSITSLTDHAIRTPLSRLDDPTNMPIATAPDKGTLHTGGY